MPHAFYALIVEINVRHFNVRRQRVGFDCKAVIMRRDFDSAPRYFLHRLIPTAMAEDQLERLRAKRSAQQLMSETDPEHRDTRIQ
mgnify:CR=1 FL=1